MDTGTRPETKPWVGIGLFNEAKLTAYRGGGLMRLGRHAQAHARGGDPDASAQELTHAVGIIAETLHANSLRRATGLYEDVRATRTPAVRRLGHQLRELEAMT